MSKYNGSIIGVRNPKTNSTDLSHGGIYSLNYVHDTQLDTSNNSDGGWSGIARAENATIYVIAVGGGAGGAGEYAGSAVPSGGGGGGGVVEGKMTIYKDSGDLNVTIGAGGSKTAGINQRGGSGGDTKLTATSASAVSAGISDIFTAKGGGGGGFYVTGNAGGCGGGGGWYNSAGGSSTQTDNAFRGAPSGTLLSNANVVTVVSSSQYGTSGGIGVNNLSHGGSAGGGAGAAGGNAGTASTSSNGTDGGAGKTLYGTTYAGGGGGGQAYNIASANGGAGGTGGGGAGSSGTSSSDAGGSGTANTGGGGGGGVSQAAGGSGGSGTLIVYTDSTGIHTTGSPTITTVSQTIGSDTYTKKYVFTGDGTIGTVIL